MRQSKEQGIICYQKEQVASRKLRAESVLDVKGKEEVSSLFGKDSAKNNRMITVSFCSFFLPRTTDEAATD